MRTVLGLVGPPQLGGVCKGNRKGGSPSSPTSSALLADVTSLPLPASAVLSQPSTPVSSFMAGRWHSGQFLVCGVHP